MYFLHKPLVIGMNEAFKERISWEFDKNTRDDVVRNMDFEFDNMTHKAMWYDIGFGELRFTVWWDYRHDLHPFAHLETFRCTEPMLKKKYYPTCIGAIANCWIERATGRYIQDMTGKRMYGAYCRQDTKKYLESLPDPVPVGFKVGGKFFV